MGFFIISFSLKQLSCIWLSRYKDPIVTLQTNKIRNHFVTSGVLGRLVSLTELWSPPPAHPYPTPKTLPTLAPEGMSATCYLVCKFGPQ